MSVAVADPEEDTAEEQGDRFFNPWRTPRTASSRALVEEAVSSILLHEQTHSPRQRRRKRADMERLEVTVSALFAT